MLSAWAFIAPMMLEFGFMDYEVEGDAFNIWLV